jgi:hypothetical protein
MRRIGRRGLLFGGLVVFVQVFVCIVDVVTGGRISRIGSEQRSEFRGRAAASLLKWGIFDIFIICVGF